jgi:broad specificity phosphatase PhoE
MGGPTIVGVTTILLARHGETDWNRDYRFQGHADPPLNERGRAQAQALADELADERIDAVYASPLRRALETAEIVTARLGLPIHQIEALREVDVGSWSGLTRTEVERAFPEGYRRWLDYGPGWADGETYEAMGERVVAALRAIADRHNGEVVLAVTHGGPIRAAHAYAAKVPHSEARRVGAVVDNCALCRFVVENRSFRQLD